MTSEIRPEALVAHEVCEEMEEYGPTFAERVIKADREAVRAEVVGEIVAWLGTKDNYDFDDLAIDIEAKFGKIQCG